MPTIRRDLARRAVVGEAKDTPRLSVVIPAYNVGRFIGDAVRSALAQTYRDLEVIVVDDGSTDSTAEVVRSFHDPRLRLVQQTNGGLSNARNTGVREARGQYIGFLDGDDIWRPNKAARHVELLDSSPEVGLSFSHSTFMDENGVLTGRILYCWPEQPTLEQMIFRNRVGNGSSPVARATCLRAAGPFDEALRSCEDWEMWVRVLRDTPFKARLIPEVLTCYRINTQSLSHNTAKFLHYADLAAARIYRETPLVRVSVIDTGLASTYRIAATKALRAGDRRTSARIMLEALRICPSLLFRDTRAIGNLVLLALPQCLLAFVFKRVGASAQLKGSGSVAGG